MTKGLNNLIKGRIGTNIAVNWFLRNGFTVYEPTDDVEKIDFIARKISKGKNVKPHYVELQVKSNTTHSFWVPRREYGWANSDYFYVFVHIPKEEQPHIYLMTQEEVKRLRYKSTRKLKGRNPKQFEKRTVVIKLSKKDRAKYDIDKRKSLFKRLNE